jgi:hypothetical protein
MRSLRSPRRSLFSLVVIAATVSSQTVFPSHNFERRVPENTPSRLTPNQRTEGLTKAAFGKLPLRFEANQGQTDERVRFLARGGNYTAFFTPEEAVFAFKAAARTRGKGASAKTDGALRMRWVGANGAALLSGLDPLPGQSNYFIGSDPSRWRTAIPGYGKVQYGGLYPGIDLIFYGRQNQMEYDFRLAPAADAADIRLSFDGARRLRLDAQGDLVLSTRHGDVRQRKPFAYQVVGSEKREVAADFILKGGREVGFKVGPYDRSLPLVIDPVFTYLGGSGEDEGYAVAYLGGYVYIAGATNSADFPTTAGAAQRDLCCARSTDPRDAFVAKLDASLSTLDYATYLGGSEAEQVNSSANNWQSGGLAVDALGNAYVTGNTLSTNFPATSSAYQRNNNGSYDAFLAKLNATGGALAYSTYLGGSASDHGYAVAVDMYGAAYVTGTVIPVSGGSKLFPLTTGAIQKTDTAMDDAFVTKIDTTKSGSASLVYSTFLGGDNQDGGTGIAAAPDGSYAVVTGYAGTPRSSGAKFPVTASAYQATGAGYRDAFLTKMRFTGNPQTDLVYSTLLGGSSEDRAFAVALDAAGYAYLAGKTSSTAFPVTAGVVQTTYKGSGDAFVARVNPAAWGKSSLVFSTYLGGVGIDEALGLAPDAQGVWVVGRSESTSGFVTTDGSAHHGAADAFVVNLSASGQQRLYSTLLGGAEDDLALGVGVGSDGIYLTGYTLSTGLASAGVLQSSPAGGQEAFVAKYLLPTP